jgi:hypothetical protein
MDKIRHGFSPCGPNGAGPALNAVTRTDRRQAPIDPWEPTEGFRESVMTRMSVTGRRHAASGQEPAWMRLARSASLGMAAIIMYQILGWPGYFTMPIAWPPGSMTEFRRPDFGMIFRFSRHGGSRSRPMDG